jgi:glycosyltransferase involved in cell wall biosynthesis
LRDFSPLKILLIHNFYRQPGGEDRVFATEASVLREKGHEVSTFVRHNPSENGLAMLRLVGKAFWNQDVYGRLRCLIREKRPDVVHLHNTFPLISPAACYAAARERVPIIQTLHNYRQVCVNGLLFRDGQPCELCIERQSTWPGIRHACYRGGYTTSTVAGATLALHRALGSWTERVHRHIALTEFARQKFIASGFPANRVVVKPNMIHPDLGVGSGDGGFALFVGRLSPEKGVDTLLRAWSQQSKRVPLIIAGDGPLAARVRQAVESNPAISWIGQKGTLDVQDLMGRATCVIVPSMWYETFGLVVAEAFARGTPVVAARLGALQELVEHGRTGLLFTPGDDADLARQVRWIWDNQQALAAMRLAARAAYEARWSIHTNYDALLTIYADAIAVASSAMGDDVGRVKRRGLMTRSS